jgi:hypothetical protein
MKIMFALGGAALLLSSAATAQDADASASVAEAGLPAAPTAAEVATPADTSAAAGGTAQASASFSDTQIDSYVTAAIAVQEMQADTALDDAAQQARAGAILAEAGLDPTTFNAISDAISADPAVAERVQLALANRRGSREG